MEQNGNSSIGVTLYTDAACTQAATAQQVIDAFSAGGVRLSQTSGGDEVVMTVLSILHPTIATQAAGGGSSPAVILLVVAPGTASIQKIRMME